MQIIAPPWLLVYHFHALNRCSDALKGLPEGPLPSWALLGVIQFGHIAFIVNKPAEMC